MDDLKFLVQLNEYKNKRLKKLKTKKQRFGFRFGTKIYGYKFVNYKSMRADDIV